ncbi:hypothetical protein ACF0H5_002056 [Mactra antiquata]
MDTLRVTIFLLIHCVVATIGDANALQQTNTTTEIPVTEAETEPYNTSTIRIVAETIEKTTVTPIVTKASVDLIDKTNTVTEALNAVNETLVKETTTVSDLDEKTDRTTVVQTETTSHTVSTADAGNDHTDSIKRLTTEMSTSSNDIAEKQQNDSPVETVTTVYKIEAKTKYVEEITPAMENFNERPLPYIETTTDREIVQNETETYLDIASTTTSTETSGNLPIEITTESQEELSNFVKKLIEMQKSQNSFENAMTRENVTSLDFGINGDSSDRIATNQLIEWLGSMKSNRTETKSATVTVKNVDIDTRIITTDKLVIVISTICGSFVLFVVILIVVSCCRRNRNARTDSEKSGTSEFSVVSTNSIGIYEKQSSTKSRTSSIKSDYNNDLFMGIPTNNAIWKDLDSLPDNASCVMPESTKL